MSTLKELEVKNIFLIIALILISILAVRIFLPYLNIIIISLILVQIFHPVYRRILKRTKSQAISTTLSVLLTLFFMIIPILVLTLLTLSEVSRITTSNLINLNDLQGSVNSFIASINDVLKNLNLNFTVSAFNVEQSVGTFAESIKDQLFPFVQQVLSLSGEILFSIFLMLLCLVYFFPMYERLPQIISRISPLDKDLDEILYKNFRATTKGVLKGTFFVAIIQATAVLIPLLILNIGAPVLLWVIMIILSILPIGSGLVWGPLGLFLILQGINNGNPAQVVIAISLIIYSAVIINVIDTTIRPKIIKNTVNIHPLVTILSVLGGIYYFGPLGILYGPLIIVFFISMMDIYHRKFLGVSNSPLTSNLKK